MVRKTDYVTQIPATYRQSAYPSVLGNIVVKTDYESLVYNGEY